jgi:hypothetical protein
VTTPVAGISPVTLSIGGQPTQIVRSGSGTVNVYNGDLTNVLLVSPDFSPALTNSVPIQPLTNATIDGTRAQYAVAQTGTCANVTIGNALQISPSPAQIAAQISALGLATAANQELQITQETDIAGNTGNIVVSSSAIETNTGSIASSSTIIEGNTGTIETNTQNTVTNIDITNDFMGGTSPGALISAAGNTVGAEVAALIATGLVSGTPGGVPLLNMFTVLDSLTGQSLAGGPAATLLGPFDTNQPGIEGTISIQNSAAAGVATAIPVGIIFGWYDAHSNPIAVDAIWGYASGSGSSEPHIIMFHGPSKGAVLNVSIYNSSTVLANDIVFGIQLNASSRVFTKFVSRSALGYTSNNPTNPTMPTSLAALAQSNIPGRIIASVSAAALATNTNASFLLPVYSGRVFVYLSSSSGAADALMTVQAVSDLSNAGAFANTNIIQGSTNALGITEFETTLPSSQCLLIVRNQNAAAKNVLCAIKGAVDGE